MDTPYLGDDPGLEAREIAHLLLLDSGPSGCHECGYPRRLVVISEAEGEVGVSLTPVGPPPLCNEAEGVAWMSISCTPCRRLVVIRVRCRKRIEVVHTRASAFGRGVGDPGAEGAVQTLFFAADADGSVDADELTVVAPAAGAR